MRAIGQAELTRSAIDFVGRSLRGHLDGDPQGSIVNAAISPRLLSTRTGYAGDRMRGHKAMYF
jgi:hypothetical protein